jgi:hypothetical protein
MPRPLAHPPIVSSPAPDTFGIEVNRSRFPFAIVWTPIPCITWFFPFIGHMGICDSRGVAYDFAGACCGGTTWVGVGKEKAPPPASSPAPH